MSQWTRGTRARPSQAFDRFRRVFVDDFPQLSLLRSGSFKSIDTTGRAMSTLRGSVRLPSPADVLTSSPTECSGADT